ALQTKSGCMAAIFTHSQNHLLKAWQNSGRPCMSSHISSSISNAKQSRVFFVGGLTGLPQPFGLRKDGAKPGYN
ncbi:MAG: hypothetical protein Q7S94_03320, partial [Gallionella sp.]|nr:hypothetical protein [Gallionella sp.]